MADLSALIERPRQQNPAKPAVDRSTGHGDVSVQFHFSNHVLDAGVRELTRGGQNVAVEPQVFDLLVYLVENRDRVVSKDDLIETIWHGRIVSEFDADQPHQRRAHARSATPARIRR